MLAVLRLPGVRCLFANCIGRLPMGALGLLACAATGDMLFSLHPASRGWRPPPDAERPLLGALLPAVAAR